MLGQDSTRRQQHRKPPRSQATECTQVQLRLRALPPATPETQNMRRQAAVSPLCERAPVAWPEHQLGPQAALRSGAAKTCACSRASFAQLSKSDKSRSKTGMTA